MSGVPCEGRPGLACPERKCDRKVHLSQEDLMLCAACERFRFPEVGAQRPPTAKEDKVTGRVGSNKTHRQHTEEKRSSESEVSTLNLHCDSRCGT
jgi:hypothetical protein